MEFYTHGTSVASNPYEEVLLMSGHVDRVESNYMERLKVETSTGKELNEGIE